MDKHITKAKCMDFAVRIVKLSKYIKDTQKEYDLASQLTKSGTSIGANFREAQNAASKKDFINKVTVALKEANETEYWLELLYKVKYISEKEYESIYSDCNELVRLLTSIVKTSKKNEEIDS